MANLGFCGGDSDTLSYYGMTATWTPDGAGGGVLAVTIPPGTACGGTDADWGLSLYLLRTMCGQRLKIQVVGTGSQYDPSSGGVYAITAAGTVMSLNAPGGGVPCMAGDWVLTSGANPGIVTAGCGDAGVGYTVSIGMSGVNAEAPETTTTITVTVL
jgi:hypothetical protein